jgi:hypothetical protein
MSSTQVYPIGGNQYYTGLQGGTSNAMESFSSSSSSLSQAQAGPFKTIDVTVKTAGLTAGQVLNLAGPLPLGTVFPVVSVDGNQQVLPGTTNTYGLGLALSSTVGPITTLITAVPTAGVVATAPSAAVGTTINGGATNLNTAPASPVVTAATGQYVNLIVPVVGAGAAADSGSFRVKIVYFTTG